MALDDLLADRQPNTGAAVLLDGVQPLEAATARLRVSPTRLLLLRNRTRACRLEIEVWRRADLVLLTELLRRRFAL